MEHPFYTQLQFAIDRMRDLAPQHPEWQGDPALKAALDRDIPAIAAQGMAGLAKIAAVSHTGVSTEELADVVRAVDRHGAPPAL